MKQISETWKIDPGKLICNSKNYTKRKQNIRKINKQIIEENFLQDAEYKCLPNSILNLREKSQSEMHFRKIPEF